MNQPTEQNRVALSLITQAWHGDKIAACFHCCPASHYMAKLCPCSQIDFLRNSITLWNEEPVLVDGTGFRVRAIHCSGNVSHFHEYWMNTVGRLSLSLWFVFLPPSLSSTSVWTVTFSPAPAARSLKQISVFSPRLCGWDPSLGRHCNGWLD